MVISFRGFLSFYPEAIKIIDNNNENDNKNKTRVWHWMYCAVHNMDQPHFVIYNIEVCLYTRKFYENNK